MSEADSSCKGCALRSRRDFVRDSIAAALGAVMSIGWIDAVAKTAGTVTYPLPTADGAQIDRVNDVILVRWQGVVYAFSLSCPHQKTALRWVEKNNRFQCPKHKSKFQPDGTFISGRATRNMDRFPLKRSGGSVIVDTSAVHRQDRDAGGWAAAALKLEQ